MKTPLKICLVGSILRHIIHSPAGTYSGWGGMTESAVAPFAALLRNDSIIRFVGSVGREDVPKVREFFRTHYPLVDASGIRVNPTGTDEHSGNKDFVKVKIRVEPTKYEHIEPYIHDADVVLFNFGNIDDIDPAAIKKVKENSKAFVYVDVHRKPFGVDQGGYIYSRGWPEWEEYLRHADVVQMNKNECEALLRRKIKNIGDAVSCAREVLSAGVDQLLITLGSKGVLVARKSPSSKYMFARAIPCRVVDTTGCGDAFAAGYLVSRHEGGSLKDSIKLGSLMASINCEFVGYMKNINRATIERKLPANFKLTELNPK